MRGLSLLIAACVGHIVVNEFLALIGGIYFAVRFFLKKWIERAIGRRWLLMMIFTGGRPPKG